MRWSSSQPYTILGTDRVVTLAWQVVWTVMGLVLLAYAVFHACVEFYDRLILLETTCTIVDTRFLTEEVQNLVSYERRRSAARSNRLLERRYHPQALVEYLEDGKAQTVWVNVNPRKVYGPASQALEAYLPGLTVPLYYRPGYPSSRRLESPDYGWKILFAGISLATPTFAIAFGIPRLVQWRKGNIRRVSEPAFSSKWEREGAGR
jgi:hypothetical protein